MAATLHGVANRHIVSAQQRQLSMAAYNPFDCLSDDYQKRLKERAEAEAIMATKVRLQVQF